MTHDLDIRELKEECGLIASHTDLTKIGLIHFEFKDDPVILEVHVFTTVKYEGSPIETEGKQLGIYVDIYVNSFILLLHCG